MENKKKILKDLCEAEKTEFHSFDQLKFGEMLKSIIKALIFLIEKSK